ncbi:hypothetical protein BC834DRAFT_974521 [Gloeopeniophorella convolvens]|nr:hypothetical protein BC834DRAFT_974521 [Gloeopeniophorella convolvens]
MPDPLLGPPFEGAMKGNAPPRCARLPSHAAQPPSSAQLPSPAQPLVPPAAPDLPLGRPFEGAMKDDAPLYSGISGSPDPFPPRPLPLASSDTQAFPTNAALRLTGALTALREQVKPPHPSRLPEEERKNTGRISRESTEAMEEAFDRIDDVFDKLGKKTNLPPSRLLKFYNKRLSPRLSSDNSWNSYQASYAENGAEERRRLSAVELRDAESEAEAQSSENSSDEIQGGAPGQNTTIRLCYHKFKEAYGDSYRRFLEVWMEQRQLRVNSASKFHRFDTVLITVGGSINDDSQLSACYETRGVAGFLSDRLGMDKEVAQGHLKAQSYDHYSREDLKYSNFTRLERAPFTFWREFTL